MKNKRFICAVTAILSIAALSSCGNVGSGSFNSDSSSESLTTQNETTTIDESSSVTESTSDKSSSESSAQEITSANSDSSSSDKQQQSTSAIESSKDDSSNSSAEISKSDTDYDAILNPLLTGLNEVDKLYTTFIDMSSSEQFIDSTQLTYSKVTDSRFTSVSDVKTFVKQYITDSMLDSNGRYSQFFSSSSPLYIDYNGALYVRSNAKGGDFTWTNTPAEVSSVTETSFTAIKEYTSFDAPEYMELKLVKTDDGWRINNAQTLYNYSSENN